MEHRGHGSTPADGTPAQDGPARHGRPAAHEGHSDHTDHGRHPDHGRHTGHKGDGGSLDPDTPVHGPARTPAHADTHDGHGGASWSTAAKATLHCLTGCAIGEILGMVIGTALLWSNVPTMALAIFLAFVFGYSFTLFAVLRVGLDLRSAIKVALAADTVSIAVMEIVDNGIIAAVPGAMDASLADALFWSALLGGFGVAFLVTTPVNKWMIGRGKGHAVVHAYH